MLSLILGAVTGMLGPLATVAGKIIDLKAAKNEAASSIAKAQIDEQIEAAHDKRSVLIAEAGNRVTAILNTTVRTLLALPVVAFLAKILLWDKVVGSFSSCAGPEGAVAGCDWFRTDALDTNLWWVITAIIAFYFIYDFGSKLVNNK